MKQKIVQLFPGQKDSFMHKLMGMAVQSEVFINILGGEINKMRMCDFFLPSPIALTVPKEINRTHELLRLQASFLDNIKAIEHLVNDIAFEEAVKNGN